MRITKLAAVDCQPPIVIVEAGLPFRVMGTEFPAEAPELLWQGVSLPVRRASGQRLVAVAPAVTGTAPLVGRAGSETVEGPLLTVIPQLRYTPAKPPTPTPIPTPTPTPGDLLYNDAWRREDIANVNQARATAGLKALVEETRLMRCAQDWCERLCREGFFSHVGPDGSTLGSRLQTGGYVYRSAGENIARGYTGPRAVHLAWMDSPGHRANIVSPYYTQIGTGYCSLKNGSRPCWVEVFGTPR